MTLTKSANSPSRTILLVDDDSHVCRLIERILSDKDTRILTADSGARAVQIAGRTPLDLVILDVKLPDMSGTEVLRRLRSFDAGMPVIMVTGYGSVETVRTAMELGAVDCLTKPFSRQEMTQAVREALASRHVSARLANRSA